MNQKQENWDSIIEDKTNLFDLRYKKVWRCRDLLIMFAKRDFITDYKQTILGPIRFFVQPISTTIIYVILFGQVTKVFRRYCRFF
jgi:lipopolysaccharide transport system permease protein